jgi:SAM-dependent methyltransferase
MENDVTSLQTNLSREQVAAFYHDDFVEDQIRDFVALVGVVDGGGVVLDVGGGMGFFARRLRAAGYRVRVLDTDRASVASCQQAGLEAALGDALDPPVSGDERVVSFNLVLHHLVGSSERVTRDLQASALGAWLGRAERVFVNEYIYESYVGHCSGRLIYQVTKSRLLSWVGRIVSKAVPSLRANTFGVGVRFRAHGEWRGLFAAAGYTVESSSIGRAEAVSLAQRLLMIRQIRRDSFVLKPGR